jgi:predicted nucleic acid-binding protein
LIVLDASALVDFLLNQAPQRWVARRMLESGGELSAPSCVDVEVVSALRRHVQRGTIGSRAGTVAIDQLIDLDLRRHAETAFLHRMWQLRNNLTAFDAAYVALAEALDAPLVTTDAALARTPGHSARILTYSPQPPSA